MCGRYASFRQAQDLADAFAVHGVIQGVLLGEPVTTLPPSWNVAPTDLVRIVVDRATEAAVPAAPGRAGRPLERSVRLARWGLVPSWAKDPSGGARMINARSESVADKPAFRKALAARRCLVPAEGYYEWLPREPGAGRAPKQPVFIHPADGGVLALAGLYEFWRDPERSQDDPDRWLTTVTIVTSAASGELAEIHERRPVGLRPEHWDAWLDPSAGAEVALGVLATDPPEMAHHRVSTAVNRVGTQGSELVEPVAG